MTTKVTSKGQVTIPKRVRDAMGIRGGTKVTVEYRDGGALVLPERKVKKSDFEKAVERARAKFRLGMTTDEYLDLTRDRKR